MHQGEDTEYYLKKGFAVIGFEADPGLVEKCKAKFASEIEQSRMIIVEGAIVDYGSLRPAQQTVKFYKNVENSVWGTVFENWARRNEVCGSPSEIIEVNAIDFRACLDRYGIPYYMKIDIEGADGMCLEALRDCSRKPRYVSIESEKVDFLKLEAEIGLLESLGYTGFKAVQQQSVPAQVPPVPSKEGVYAPHKFPAGSSGVFGRELPNGWKSKDQILAEYRRIFSLYKWFGDTSRLGRSKSGQLFIRYLSKVLRTPIPGWYDTHARHSSAVTKESRASASQ